MARISIFSEPHRHRVAGHDEAVLRTPFVHHGGSDHGGAEMMRPHNRGRDCHRSAGAELWIAASTTTTEYYCVHRTGTKQGLLTLRLFFQQRHSALDHTADKHAQLCRQIPNTNAWDGKMADCPGHLASQPWGFDIPGCGGAHSRCPRPSPLRTDGSVGTCTKLPYWQVLLG